MDIDQLAALVEREFDHLHAEMAKLDELKATEADVLRAVEALGTELSHYASRWNNEFERLTDNVRNLESRIRPHDSPP